MHQAPGAFPERESWVDLNRFAGRLKARLSAAIPLSSHNPIVVDMSNVNVEDLVTVPKTENSEDGSFSETSPEPDEQSFIQESAQVQKRKGGRKPV